MPGVTVGSSANDSTGGQSSMSALPNFQAAVVSAADDGSTIGTIAPGLFNPSTIDLQHLNPIATGPVLLSPESISSHISTMPSSIFQYVASPIDNMRSSSGSAVRAPVAVSGLPSSVQQQHQLHVAYRKPTSVSGSAGRTGQPYIEIIEQPKSSAMRFRYECEGRSAGTILGEKSTQANRTYPTIKIHNCGPAAAAVVVVSCVMKDPPYYPHPHSLVGQHCKDSVCTLKSKGTDTITMMNVGIQCSKRQGVKAAIELREKIRVDPFGTGYERNVEKIDLSAVRLCFQAFLPDESKRFSIVVPPVLSEPIHDKKLVKSLAIYRLSKRSSSVRGGEEVILLCDKIKKDDIEVRFFHEDADGEAVWEGFGVFQPADVHHQCAIAFKTPAYSRGDGTVIESSVDVQIQLRRRTDQSAGEPKEFTYIPDFNDIEGAADGTSRKRRSWSNEPVPAPKQMKSSPSSSSRHSKHQRSSLSSSSVHPAADGTSTEASDEDSMTSSNTENGRGWTTDSGPSLLAGNFFQQSTPENPAEEDEQVGQLPTDQTTSAYVVDIGGGNFINIQVNADGTVVLPEGVGLVTAADGTQLLTFDARVPIELHHTDQQAQDVDQAGTSG